jgi:hypothetical protein
MTLTLADCRHEIESGGFTDPNRVSANRQRVLGLVVKYGHGIVETALQAIEATSRDTTPASIVRSVMNEHSPKNNGAATNGEEAPPSDGDPLAGFIIQ